MTDELSLRRQYIVKYLPKIGRTRPEKVSERNWEIVQRVKGYEPMASVARDYGITRQRVTVIIAQTIYHATGVSYEGFRKELV